jgi:hypothetical protein
MAWADIKAYTAADLAKGKAEIDEVINAISAKLSANRHRNGKLTDEEHYTQLFINQTLVPRSGEFSTNIVGGLINAATYSMNGDDVVVAGKEAETKVEIVAEIAKVIDALELDGCAYVVAETAYTAPTAEANGSYKFKVTVSKAGKNFITPEITATIVKLTA